MAAPKKDEVTGTDTTGHEWDGIQELNTPLPRWWLIIFYMCVIWAVGYMVVYPAIPLPGGFTEGVIGYSSRADVEAKVAEARAEQSVWLDRIAAADLETIRNDTELLSFALAGGESAYSVNCSQCHGSGAQGAVGFPNLNDDAWLWGGELEQIAYTITHGIRNGTDDAHYSEMPAYGVLEILTPQEIEATADYVLSLSGAGTANETGATVFAEQCSACHGEAGEGIPELGAPALNDAIWLYGGDRDTVIYSITNARAGVMPAWGPPRLSEETVKQLAIYVHALGGGQ